MNAAGIAAALGDAAMRDAGFDAWVCRARAVRIEREIVDRHRALGVHAERYPFSGASRFRDSGHDVDVYLFGRGRRADRF